MLTNTQVSRFCKACANGSSANIKLSKNHLHKIQTILGAVLITRLHLMKNVLKPLAKATAASATDAAIHKKCLNLVVVLRI